VVGRLAVLVLIAVAVLPAGASAAQRTDGSTTAPPAIIHSVTGVPATALDQVGAGQLAGPNDFGVFRLHHALRHNGKPELVTMNLAWCPHCAANSWSLAVALSRFGTLTGLRVLDTGTHFCKLLIDPCPLSPASCFPHTHGLSFLTARFRSPYLSFKGVVLQDVRGNHLEHPTKQENAAFSPFAPHGAAPAVDVGGDFGFLNSGYSPGVLAHKTWSQIADSLARPHTRIARHVDGLANLFTAAICRSTGDHPARVCHSPAVTAGAARLSFAQ
jgi:hypothetical protein